MDQKNTIVKCKARPDCLFNHNGVCDNYVINIGKDGKCECYVETATCQNCKFYEDKKLLQNKCIKDGYYYLRTAPTCSSFQEKVNRGQRAECNVYDDVCDASFLKEDLEKIQQTLEQDSILCTMKVAEFNKPNKNKSVIKPMSDHLCDIRCVSAHYAEDGKLYCALIQDFPERPFRCSAYDDGGEE